MPNLLLLTSSLLAAQAVGLAPPLRVLLSRSAKPKAREEAITLITEMERDERDAFLDTMSTFERRREISRGGL